MNEDCQYKIHSWSGVVYVLNSAASLGGPDDVPWHMSGCRHPPLADRLHLRVWEFVVFMDLVSCININSS